MSAWERNNAWRLCFIARVAIITIMSLLHKVVLTVINIYVTNRRVSDVLSEYPLAQYTRKSIGTQLTLQPIGSTFKIGNCDLYLKGPRKLLKIFHLYFWRAFVYTFSFRFKLIPQQVGRLFLLFSKVGAFVS